MQNVILYEDKIQGSGVLESPCYAKSKIEGKFYVGAYTFLSHLSKVQNCFIGRYSRVDDLCTLGLNKEKKERSVIISLIMLKMDHLEMTSTINLLNRKDIFTKRKKSH
ncbi:hypothetical protein HQH74_22600 [Escherichia coli]|nr:hypothetical protein [Escherichia coli]